MITTALCVRYHEPLCFISRFDRSINFENWLHGSRWSGLHLLHQRRLHLHSLRKYRRAKVTPRQMFGPSAWRPYSLLPPCLTISNDDFAWQDWGTTSGVSKVLSKISTCYLSPFFLIGGYVPLYSPGVCPDGFNIATFAVGLSRLVTFATCCPTCEQDPIRASRRLLTFATGMHPRPQWLVRFSNCEFCHDCQRWCHKRSGE